ncbi:MAG TPA: LuxR C-terminal-related transcriptional regulator, partial [Thermoleophilaceae bacterium]|nr:LuxR C-terminal-related transcriptional regulator [Thermoleophilaceae bacterium]
ADRRGAAELLREARTALAHCPDVGSAGRSLEAAEAALRAPSRAARRTSDRRDELTEREIAVLRLLAAGELSRREIADALYVSLDTVKTHMRGIYRKLGAGSREEAVTGARERGLI